MSPASRAKSESDFPSSDPASQPPPSTARPSPTQSSGGRNLLFRVITALVTLPAIAAVLFWAPALAFFAVPGLGALLAAWEFFGLTHPDDRPIRVTGTVLTILMFALFVATRFGSVSGSLALIGVALLAPLALLIALLRPGSIPTALPRTSALVMGPLYLGAPMAMLALVRTFGTRDEGAGLIVVTLMFAWLGDTTAYFVGRALKGPKLYPAASPNKTWSGAFGGLGGSISGAALAHFTFLPSLPLDRGVILAACAAVLGQAGDLAESALKRSARVKDAGGILPGHGGMLDRIDALLFCAVVVFIALRMGWLPYSMGGGGA